MINRAIKLLEHLMFKENNNNVAYRWMLSQAYSNKADILRLAQRLVEALPFCNKAIALREQIVFDEGNPQLAGEMCIPKVSKARILGELGEINKARDLLHEIIPFLEQEYKKTQQISLKDTLAMAQDIMDKLRQEI
jgi:hypothetical protein